MNKAKKNWLTVFVLILVATIIYLGFFIFSKTSQSEIRILFLPKSDTAVRNINQILANAEQIPLSLDFYTKLLTNNPDIFVIPADSSLSSQKTTWNQEINIKRVGRSGIIAVTATNNDSWQAEIISRAVANDLIRVMSRYYNISNELEMRIIDGPISNSETRQIPPSAPYLSILGALFIAGMIRFVLSIDREMPLPQIPRSLNWNIKAPIKEELEVPELNPTMAKTGFEPKAKAEPIEIKPKPLETEKPKMTSEPTMESNNKTASAPGNLPIAPDSIVKLFGAVKNGNYKFESKVKTEPIQEKPAVYKEASPEEVKARLNKLLGGV